MFDKNYKTIWNVMSVLYHSQALLMMWLRTLTVLLMISWRQTFHVGNLHNNNFVVLKTKKKLFFTRFPCGIFNTLQYIYGSKKI